MKCCGRFLLTANLLVLIFGLFLLGPPCPDAAAQGKEKSGLITSTDGAFSGYTLFCPLRSTTTCLFDMKGNLVHQWKSEYTPGNSVYLKDNGELLRSVREPERGNFSGGGIGGRILLQAWDGTVLWNYRLADDTRWQHHDIEPLPNGNVLAIAWERKSKAEALAAGRLPSLMGHEQFWPDMILEIKPEPPTGGKVVWEWHIWDHLIQDRDPKKANYGVIKDHPELVDINADGGIDEPSEEERKHLEAIGYIEPRRERPNADWNHTNSVDYNPELDQILISVRRLNEIFVIDHSTTTEEASGHKGGRQGKGGDILYRWGNPRNYRQGTPRDQQLYRQHDARWIPVGFPGEGNITIYNNGNDRPGGVEFSEVFEIVPPAVKGGGYSNKEGRFGPEEPKWSYSAPNKSDLYSGRISGAHRVANGNTLICCGEQGRVFEVTPSGEIVWDFINPIAAESDQNRGDGRGAGRGGRGGPDRPERRDARGATGRGRERGAEGRQGRGGPGGRGGRGSQRALFRATRISPDHPALKGKDLSPKKMPTPEKKVEEFRK